MGALWSGSRAAGAAPELRIERRGVRPPRRRPHLEDGVGSRREGRAPAGGREVGVFGVGMRVGVGGGRCVRASVRIVYTVVV